MGSIPITGSNMMDDPTYNNMIVQALAAPTTDQMGYAEYEQPMTSQEKIDALQRHGGWDALSPGGRRTAEQLGVQAGHELHSNTYRQPLGLPGGPLSIFGMGPDAGDWSNR